MLPLQWNRLQRLRVQRVPLRPRERLLRMVQDLFHIDFLHQILLLRQRLLPTERQHHLVRMRMLQLQLRKLKMDLLR